MRVLVGCEFSGTVREAFRARGHEAWSVDLLPTDIESEFHIVGDVLDVLDRGWDVGIFFPPCTHLAASGARHPWQFGHTEEKTTCLWLVGLPALVPTSVCERPSGGWSNRTPSGNCKTGEQKHRWKKRSKTYQGIADAMAEQWGKE